MKIYTSYFYQLRFFKPYMIPLSTAVGDPKWFHNGTKNKSIVTVDKNGVINGLRINPLVPGPQCSNLCSGADNCLMPEPDVCMFMHKYYEQLKRLDFDEFMDDLKSHIRLVCKMYSIEHEPIVVMMVHEAADNRCSERFAIQRWFKENGLEISELDPKMF